MSNAVSQRVEPGQILAGKYRIERVIGRGGMGLVVAATHIELERLVAIKLVARLRSEGASRRFLREARAASELRSPHVVRVLDVGRLADEAPYLVMEYLEGEDLEARLQRGPLPVQEAVDHLLEASDAMSEAHEAGIVHRDLKPANLFVSRERLGSKVLRVLDFGVSKLPSNLGWHDTQTPEGALKGTPLYMSPEQMQRPQQADYRADIWALGAIAHELLAGSPAFQGQGVVQICAAVLQREPPLLEKIRPELPWELAAVIRWCLNKDPERRPTDVPTLVEALAPFAGDRGRIVVERLRWTRAAAGRVSAPPARGSVASRSPAPRTTAPGWALGTRSGRSISASPLGRRSLTPGAMIAIGALATLGTVGALRTVNPSLARAGADSLAVDPDEEPRRGSDAIDQDPAAARVRAAARPAAGAAGGGAEIGEARGDVAPLACSVAEPPAASPPLCTEVGQPGRQ